MSSEIVLVAFYLFMLVYSVILHEVAHGVVALWLGDLTAKYAGRITLSPWSHIDPFGSFIIPVVLFVTTGFAFGYAKPVPYNPYNLRDQKFGPLYVALAGPATNFLLAFIGALSAQALPLSLLAKQDILGRFLGIISGRGEFLERFELLSAAMTGSFSSIFFGLFLFLIFWNVVLGCFNLLPIPPLDGSKILFTIFPVSERTQLQLEQYGFFLLLIVIFVFSGPVSTFISAFLRFFFNLTV
ncbi:MAG: site-2 protease family protein [Candidatus Moraniibacteriota bacterium]